LGLRSGAELRALHSGPEQELKIAAYQRTRFLPNSLRSGIYRKDVTPTKRLEDFPELALKDALRAEAKLIPELAIRELVANALVHQDLTMTGVSVMIEIYSNRFEISNPGEPVVPVVRFIDGYQSRNERLATLMRRMGICEEKSSGIDGVVQTAEMYQLPAPDFRVVSSRTLVIVPKRRYGKANSGSSDTVRLQQRHR
ncbi:MAG TPA: ATP-binding protein, partial [Bryobacteraceae bacterium]|nr:ATP-binding protein [Bryobacteraceae bacterium]